MDFSALRMRRSLFYPLTQMSTDLAMHGNNIIEARQIATDLNVRISTAPYGIAPSQSKSIAIGQVTPRRGSDTPRLESCGQTRPSTFALSVTRANP